jgi:hypothetical protein
VPSGIPITGNNEMMARIIAMMKTILVGALNSIEPLLFLPDGSASFLDHNDAEGNIKLDYYIQ